MLAALAVQLWLWASYAQAQLAPHFPGGHDQAVYLSQAYARYARLLEMGLIPGLLANLQSPVPNGSRLPDVASLWFLLAGPSRLSALALNFGAFLGLQYLLTRTLLRTTGSFTIACGGMALLLSSQMPFLVYGGLFDFRPDFMALCGYGAFVCLTLRSQLALSPAFTASAWLVGAATVIVRPISAPYFVGVFVVQALLILLIARGGQSGAAHGHQLRRRVLNLLRSVAGAAIVVSAGTMSGWSSISTYYFDRYGDNVVPSGQIGDGIIRGVWFYLAALASAHMTGIFAVALLAVTAAVLHKYIAGTGQATGERQLSAYEWVLLAASFILPVLFLGFYQARVPLLVAVVTTPLVLIVVLGIHRLLAVSRRVRLGPQVRRTVGWFALATSVLVGGYSNLLHVTQRPFPSLTATQVATTDRLVRDLADYVRALDESVDGRPVRFVANSLAEYSSKSAVRAVAYENRGVTLDLDNDPLDVDPFREILMWSPERQDDALAYARSSDVLLLTDPARPNTIPAYWEPFYARAQAVTPALHAIAQREFVHAGTYDLGGSLVNLYVRPRVRVTGATADGWLTSAGARLIIPAWAAASAATVEVRGDSDLSVLPPDFGVEARELVAGQPGPPLGTRFERAGASSYRITIDLGSGASRTGQDRLVQLSFSASFVPARLGINPDTRELVLKAPEDALVLPRRQP